MDKEIITGVLLIMLIIVIFCASFILSYGEIIPAIFLTINIIGVYMIITCIMFIIYFMYLGYNYHLDDEIIKNELSQYCDNIDINKNDYKILELEVISYWDKEFKTPIKFYCNDKSKLIEKFIYSHYYENCYIDKFGDEICKMVLDVEVKE